MINFPLRPCLLLLLGGLACDDKPKDMEDTDLSLDDSGSGREVDIPTDSEVSFENTGICGVSFLGTVTVDAYNGIEEIYLISEEGDGSDVCRVEFDVTSVGTPSTPCDSCLWTFTVEKSSPETLVDVDGGCASSELRLSEGRISAETETRISLGYAAEDTGHAHVLLQLNETTDVWEIISTAAWDEETFEFFYNRRDGFCGY